MGYPIARVPATEPYRGRTADLWRSALENYFDSGMVGDYGAADLDDFVKFVGTIAENAARDGWNVADVNTSVATLVSTSDPVGAVGAATVTEVGTTQHLGSRAHGGLHVKLSSHSTDPRGRTVFETRVQLVTGGTIHVGYATALPLSATSTLLTTVGRIGFYKLAGGNLVFAANSANGGTAYATGTLIASGDIVSGSYYKLGFSVNADKGVEIFVNGIFQQSASRAFNAAALPTGTLQKDVTVTNGSGTSGNVIVDYVDSFNSLC